jgi:hypothetical protein
VGSERTKLGERSWGEGEGGVGEITNLDIITALREKWETEGGRSRAKYANEN